jgi:type IV secretion system protein TrbJ
MITTPRVSIVLLLMIVLLFPPWSAAQWAVLDAGNLTQNTTTALHAVLTAANTAKSYIVQGQQLVAEYNQILNQIKQIEYMVQNLQRIPDGLNVLDLITAYGNKMTGLLGQAHLLSYDLDQATKQFDGLYKQVGAMVSTGDILAARTKLLNAQMEASQMTVEVTAVKTNLLDIYQRLCALLTGSVTAKGALDSTQIAAQQQGLMQHTLETVAAMQATHARVIAQSAAADVVMQQLQLQAMQGASGDSTPYTQAHGRFTTYGW